MLTIYHLITVFMLYTLTTSPIVQCQLRVNCGGNEYIDEFGRRWHADTFTSTNVHVTKYSPRPVANGMIDPQLYFSEAWSHKNEGTLEYHFQVPEGNYSLIFHLGVLDQDVDRTSKFKVVINGEEKDTIQVADQVEVGTALKKRYDGSVTDAGSLKVQLVPESGRASVNAIEIWPRIMAKANSILCFGDSWSDMGSSHLQSALRARNINIEVKTHGRGGTTAQDWALRNQTLVQHLLSASGPRVVWLSVGGNDLMAFMNSALSLESALSTIQGNIESILNALIEADENVRVVSFGYDFMNIDSNLLALSGKTVQDVNNIIASFNRMVEQISDSARFSNHFIYNSILGILQKASGVESTPRFDLPSPPEFMIDAIHPNSKGFGVIMFDFTSFLVSQV